MWIMVPNFSLKPFMVLHSVVLTNSDKSSWAKNRGKREHDFQTVFFSMFQKNSDTASTTTPEILLSQQKEQGRHAVKVMEKETLVPFSMEEHGMMNLVTVNRCLWNKRYSSCILSSAPGNTHLITPAFLNR